MNHTGQNLMASDLVFRPLWRPLLVLRRTGYGKTFRVWSIFQLTKSPLFKLIPADTVFDGIVVRKIVPSGASKSSNGKLTFVITDAT